MSDLRIIEVMRNGGWEITRLQDIRQGESFCMYEKEGIPFVYNNKSVFVALTDGDKFGVEISRD